MSDFQSWLDASGVPPTFQQTLVEAENAYIDTWNTFQEVLRDAGPRLNDPIQGISAQQSIDKARAAVAQAEQNKVRISEQVASQIYRAATARNTQQTEERSQQLRAAADNLTASAELSRARLQKLVSDTDIERQRANAANQLAITRAQQLGALTTPLLAEHAARARVLDQQSALANAKAAYTQAQTDVLLPAQAQNLVAQGILRQAQADQIKAEGGAKLQDLINRGVLDEAKAAQIRAKLEAPTPVTAPGGQPYIVSRNPRTGELQREPNPNFFQQQTATFQRYHDTVEQIRGMLAGGQMRPDEAEAYMGALRASLEAELRGATPFEEQRQRQEVAQRQAEMGRNLLNQRMQTGSTLADSLIRGAMGMKMFSVPENFAPYGASAAFATALGGGQSVFDTASKLVQHLGQSDPAQARQLESLTRLRTALAGSPLPNDIHQAILDAGQAQGGAPTTPQGGT